MSGISSAFFYRASIAFDYLGDHIPSRPVCGIGRRRTVTTAPPVYELPSGSILYHYRPRRINAQYH